MIKKTIASIFMLFVISANSFAMPNAALQVATPERTLFTDITYNGSSLIAVGKHGTIVTSTDGVTWSQAQVPAQVLLTAITSLSPSASWACGHDGTILFSKDDGKNWQLQQYLPEVGKPCLDIEFTDTEHGYAIGAYGMYYVTVDGGKTWQNKFIDDFVHPDDKAYLAELKEEDIVAYEEETQFILPHFNRLLIKGNRHILVGEMGLVALSENSGESWTRLDEFYPGSFFTVAAYGSDQLIVAGLRGNAFIADMNQLKFRRLNISTTATINSIVTHQEQAYMLANSGFIFKYNNTLTQSQLETGYSVLAAVSFKGKLIMATEKGLIAWEVNK
ncbi:hypothetical protein J8L98_17060 [Pseudoalteromonas sp. MMG013]|uniref:Photosynthesis system II assembly factor Ycf48/Hcf136-like domain-containing protein n=1 Tax=Pseudoalteromonas aurantia 208 TaxID=1314867 RepID=A0ABR9EA52_9GAMM|nr:MULTISPECIES: YCF48-related protein [Pseudoalteromonas]MBE0367859.1 hypothetical protein [Pseudoalteromonas aurantia 208]MBQ4863394.1 hypothetical protein [Pseudoalteromonas sp. MMG013]